MKNEKEKMYLDHALKEISAKVDKFKTKFDKYLNSIGVDPNDEDSITNACYKDDQICYFHGAVLDIVEDITRITDEWSGKINSDKELNGKEKMLFGKEVVLELKAMNQEMDRLMRELDYYIEDKKEEAERNKRSDEYYEELNRRMEEAPLYDEEEPADELERKIRDKQIREFKRSKGLLDDEDDENMPEELEEEEKEMSEEEKNQKIAEALKNTFGSLEEQEEDPALSKECSVNSDDDIEEKILSKIALNNGKISKEEIEKITGKKISAFCNVIKFKKFELYKRTFYTNIYYKY